MNFFIKTSDDKKSIKMAEDKHAATISLFGIKLVIGFNSEEKAFSFGINQTKLIDKCKKAFDKAFTYINNKTADKIDTDTIVSEVKEAVKENEVTEKELDDEELTVKSDNYIATVKLFGVGIIIAFNKKYSNFISFKKDKIVESYQSVKYQVMTK